MFRTLAHCAIAMLLLCLPSSLSAQQNAALYDFHNVKYRVSNWPMNDMMHVLMEKYGADFAKEQRGIDSLVKRINDGRVLADAAELRDPATMPTVKDSLGYYNGIDANGYAALVAAAKEKKEKALDSLIAKLVPTTDEEVKRLDDSLKVVGSFTGTKLDSLLTWLRQDEAVRNASGFKARAAMLGKGALATLYKACTGAMEATACTTGVKKVLSDTETAWKAAKDARNKAKATWAKGAKALIAAYPKAVEERTKALRKPYDGYKPAVLDSVLKHCADSSSTGCTDVKKALVKALKEQKEEVSREFTCAMPMADNRPFFVDAFADALVAISGVEEDADKKEAERLADVNFYRILTQVLASPTPDAGELCANRELQVYRRMTRAQVWALRKGHLAGKRHPGVIIKGGGKGRIRRDPAIRPILDAIRAKGTSDTTDWRKIRERVRNTPRLSSRFRADPYLSPYQLTVVNRNRFARRHAPRRLRHHVLRTKGMMALDDHDRFPFQVDHISVKFEDGVIEAIVVDGEVKEEFRFLMTRDGDHLDSVLVPHHYHKRGSDSIVAVTRVSKVTFTNSNTPIPYGNIWNFYERFADRMPLYGYSQGSGVAYHGTSEPDYMLLLSDLLHYDPALQKATSNIAPGDTIVTIDFRREMENGSSAGSTIAPSDKETGPGNPGAAIGAAGNTSKPPAQLCAGLKKDDMRKIGEFRVFTDLVGLARNQPNGLLQSEYSWRIPVKPRSNQGVNFVSYVEPMFTLVLHEQEEQQAFVGFDTATVAMGKRYVDPLNLLANNLYRVGVKLTATQLSVRYINSDFEFNPFGAYTRTMARDSVAAGTVTDSVFVDSSSTYQTYQRSTYKGRELNGIGQFTYGAELRWKMRPDGRFGFDLYGGVAWHAILDTRFGLEHTGWDQTSTLQFNMLFAGLDAHLFASPSQKFFFKFRYVAQNADFNDHFVQLMFGYNRSLRFSRSDDEKKKEADEKWKAVLNGGL